MANYAETDNVSKGSFFRSKLVGKLTPSNEVVEERLVATE